jgi:predicted transcriptional regulator
METITTSMTSAEMLTYFMQLNDTEKKSVVELLKTFATSRKDNFTVQSLHDYNEELERADAEIATGDYVTHEEVMKRYLTK